LQETIANIGPVAVTLYVSNNFQSYSSGVFKDPNCYYPNPNHAVALVGYDTDSNGNQYYILRNEWGTSWGMNGYMHFARNNNNMCGIADNAFYVNVSAKLTGNEDIPAYYLTSSKMSLSSDQNYIFNFLVLFNLFLSYFYV
jgi:C1A family cysteine protease